MRFRTEIERPRASFKISHDDHILLLGSCFSDNVGSRLKRDGFEVSFNPMGPLYNPVSLAALLSRLLDGSEFNPSYFTKDADDIYHCLDFASKYQEADPQKLSDRLNGELAALKDFFDKATVLVLTFGSSFGYSTTSDVADSVGNCHKLPSGSFTRLTINPSFSIPLMRPLLQRLTDMGKKIILTVSPIRHLADGLHGNQLSKARLLLLCDAMSDLADYFPSYEIMLDDLRDYRFYAPDMKHPSEQACDYIYELFSATYFNKPTLDKAKDFRNKALRDAHRQLL